MRVAISGDDGFVAPWLVALLDADVTLFEGATLAEPLRMDAALAACDALIHMNGHPPDLGVGRDDREVLQAMRDNARRVNEAVERHQGLHLILLGSLRVHPAFDGQSWSSDTSLVPRDTTAEGQLWSEERALEHASPTHPVTILRTANVHGVPPGGEGEARGVVHRIVKSAASGWVAMPGSPEHALDLLHVGELARVISTILDVPPPTRETLAVGTCRPTTMQELAGVIQSAVGGDVQFWDDDSRIVWGWCEADELGPRLGFLPELDLKGLVAEAAAHLGLLAA